MLHVDVSSGRRVLTRALVFVHGAWYPVGAGTGRAGYQLQRRMHTGDTECKLYPKACKSHAACSWVVPKMHGQLQLQRGLP